jgi:hypothetical protein
MLWQQVGAGSHEPNSVFLEKQGNLRTCICGTSVIATLVPPTRPTTNGGGGELTCIQPPLPSARV